MSESPFSSAEVRALARELQSLRRQVVELQIGSSTARAGLSSLDSGTWVIKDGNGVVRQQIGQQGDGTVTTVDVNAPAPPQPVEPVVTPIPGGFKVAWSGAFAGGVARPADLAWVELHVDQDPFFEVSDATLDAAIVGGKTVPFAVAEDDYVAHTVRLVAKNTSGVRSIPSGSVTVTPLQLGPGDIAPGGVGTVNLDDGAVTPPKSGTGVTQNLVPDPGFNDAGWRAKRAVPPWNFVEATTVGFTTGDWAAYCSATTSRAELIGTEHTYGVPVTPGESYYIAYDAARSASGAGVFWCEVTYRDSTGAVLDVSEDVEAIDPLLDEHRAISSLPTAAFENRHGQVTVPPNAARMKVVMVRDDEAGTSAGQLFIDRLEVRAVVTRSGTGQRVETSPSGVIVFGADGAPIGSINADGSLSMVAGQFDDSLTYGGTELSEWLDQRARGEVARVDAGSTASPVTTTEVEWLELGFTAYSGRAYKLRSSGLVARNAGQRGFNVRWTTDGTRPLLTSPLMTFNDTALGGTLFLATDMGWTDGVDREIKLLFTVKSYAGASVYWDPADVGTGFSVWIEDVGPRQPSSGGVVTPEGTGTGGGGTAPPPAPVLRTFTTTYPSTWSQTWVAGNRTRADDNGRMWQGYHPQASSYGDQASLFGFNNAQIMADLAGATVKKFEVYLYAEHWYYNSGGQVRMGTTGVGSPPGSFPAISGQRAFWSLGKPEGRWVTLNAGVTIGTEFKNGSTRALVLNASPYSRDLLHYGYFGGAGTPAGRNPAIRITYERAV